MPFTTESFIEFQAREDEARIANQIPEGTYNWEVESSEVTEINGLPRLRVVHRLDASNTGKQIGRVHSEFFNWYASETSTSPKPIEERERGLRGMTSRKLDAYLKALASAPTSTQDMGEHFNECIGALRDSDDMSEVGELLDAIGTMLEGQYITGSIKQSGDWTNLRALPFDATIGAAQSVAV